MAAPQERGEKCLWYPEFLEVTIFIITLLRISLGLLHVLPPSLKETMKNYKRQPYIKCDITCLLIYISMYVLVMLSKTRKFYLSKIDVTNFILAFSFHPTWCFSCLKNIHYPSTKMGYFYSILWHTFCSCFYLFYMTFHCIASPVSCCAILPRNINASFIKSAVMPTLHRSIWGPSHISLMPMRK